MANSQNKDLFGEFEEHVDEIKCAPSNVKTRIWSSLSILFLRYEWEKLIKDAERIELAPHTPRLSNLLEVGDRLNSLTRMVVLQIFNNKHEKDNTDECYTWGRDELRLYFALELVKPDSRIRQLFFGGKNSQKGALENREAPDELKRNFLTNIARFMLGIVAICERNVNLNLGSRSVSTAEEIDSLLYLVDRYVHVELEVDERIDIRGHLCRQIAAEVQQYLAKPHYRDHLLHAIDVFFLGLVLLHSKIQWLEGKQQPLLEHLSLLGLQKKSHRALSHSREWERNWAVASLLHDIGYQIGDGEKVSHDPMVWDAFFALGCEPCMPQLVFPQTFRGEDYKKARERQTSFIDGLIREIRNFSSIHESLFPREIRRATDHGILSALRVAQILFNLDSLQTAQRNKGQGCLIRDYQDAIQAIAYHNLHDRQVFLHKNPMACLLRICDELQEWDRRRVNMEKVVKGLYLDIQQGGVEDLGAHDTLDRFQANIKFKGKNRKVNTEKQVEYESKYDLVVAQDEKPRFRFRLEYKDSVRAQFDPIMTLLGKSFNLQHLDLADRDQGQNDLNFLITMVFPNPEEYSGITEYDMYGLFTEVARELPLLENFPSIDKAKLGLFRINGEGSHSKDVFGIRLTRDSHPEYHLGWLSVNPGQYFDRFQEFKTRALAQCQPQAALARIRNR